MRVTALLFSLGLILFSFGSVVGQGIAVDHVDGLDDPAAGEFSDGATLTFHMRVTGDADPHLMLNNGYTFSSANCTWGSLTGAYNTAYPIDTWFDFIAVINFWANGSIEDTVGTGLLSLFGSGLPADFDGILYTFTIGPVNGVPGDQLTLDSSWYPPSNPWMWDVVGEDVAWGGPYTYSIPQGGVCEEGPSTHCTPQPTILKAIDRVLYVHIACEDNATVDFGTIRVGNIPPYEPVYVDGDGEIVTSAFVFRFLGASGFRPVTADFEATYTVYYNYLDGSAADPIIGDYALKVYPGDVTFDGQANMDDIIFAADYFWRGGGVPSMLDKEGTAWECTELLDANQDGSIDPRDVIEIMNIVL